MVMIYADKYVQKLLQTSEGGAKELETGCVRDGVITGGREFGYRAEGREETR